VSGTLNVKQTKTDIYAGADPRDLPAYTVREVSICLDVSMSRLKAWIAGQSNFRKVLTPAALVDAGASRSRVLSFNNVIEIFVLDELRRRGFSLQRLRRVLDYLRREFPSVEHPLVRLDLSISNRHLYAKWNSRLVNVSLEGQYGMEELLRTFLARVERDPGAAGVFKLYPFVTKQRTADAPKTVVMDPRVSFGRPVLTGSGIPTAVIADRFRAGESIASIAGDYDRTEAEIEEAIRYETVRVAREAA